MSTNDQRMRIASVLTAATSNNIAGGGVSAESLQPGDGPRSSNLLTKDNKPSYVVLRAPRGARVACSRALCSGLFSDAFELARVSLRRTGGTWVARTEPVWPGYVLAEPAPGVAEKDLGAVGSLGPFESALVRRLGGAAHVIQPSQGRVVGGRLVVDFGPLAGLEPLVSKIDRHHRLAWLEPEPGRRIPVGLEVTSKS